MIRPTWWLRVAVLLAMGSGLAVPFMLGARIDAHVIRDLVDDWPVAMPLVFVLAHVVASLLWIPRTMMALAAGLLFGLVGGLVWSMVGAMAGAYVSFALARHLQADAPPIAEWSHVGPLVRRAESGGWRFVALLRLIPVVPHTLSNYAFGLTRMPLGAYLVGTFAGMMPLAFVYVNLGRAGRAGLTEGEWIAPVAFALALLALSIVLPRLLAGRARLLGDR